MSARTEVRLAIVGAGPAGLAAAWKLRDVDQIDVALFEKSEGGCGRAATRSRHGLLLDTGANYFRTDLSEVSELIHRNLPTDELLEIIGDIGVFDGCGAISPGDSVKNRERRWTYRSGISTLGKLLAEAASCDLRYGVRVARINQQSHCAPWQVFDNAGNNCGEFDAVLLALPAPQALELLSKTESEIGDALATANYQSQWTFNFGFSIANPWPGQSYALINSDRQHRIAWLSRESAKPFRFPADVLAVMAQMQPQWSRENYDGPVEALAAEVSESIADLLGWRSAEFLWFDAKRWKYSLPTSSADTTRLRQFERRGLYVAGDSVLGTGRVTRSLQTGLDAAGRIRDSV